MGLCTPNDNSEKTNEKLDDYSNGGEMKDMGYVRTEPAPKQRQNKEKQEKNGWMQKGDIKKSQKQKPETSVKTSFQEGGMRVSDWQRQMGKTPSQPQGKISNQMNL